MNSKIISYPVLLTLFFITTGEISPEKSPVSDKQKTAVNPVFSFSHAHRQGQGITFMWMTNTTPSSVTGFAVYRTYEDPSDPYAEWAEMTYMPCTGAHSYSYTENTVSPGFVSYQAMASMTGGGCIFSDVETVHIVQH